MKKIAHQVLRILLIHLLACLLLAPGVARAAPPQILFYTDWTILPGRVFYLTSNVEWTFFPAPQGHIYSIAVGPDGVLYFSNFNDNKLFRWTGGKPSVVYQHGTYLRDVAFDPAGNLYFSESSGGRADGKIYRLEDGVAKKFLDVPLNKVDGFWQGYFAFAPDGTLYLSSGNLQQSAKLYRWTGAAFLAVYEGPGSISGFDFDRDGSIYYADWSRRIYKLNTSSSPWTPSVEREDPARHFADVAVLKEGSIALGPEAGRVNSVAVHPTDSKILYAGTDSGGVFRSYDEGQSWYWRSAGISNPRVGDVLVHPLDPSVVLAVTPSGIFRSMNQGLTWSQILTVNFPLPPPDLPLRLRTMHKNPIRYDSSDGTIYAAPFCAGLYKSITQGLSWEPVTEPGIPTGSITRCVTSIDVSPEGGGTVFITTPAGIRKKSSGAATWDPLGTEITPGQPVSLKVVPSNPSRIYVVAFDLFTSSPKSNVWRRDSIGGQFAPTATVNLPWLDWFDLSSLAVDARGRTDRVWVGGVPLLYFSANSGQSWTDFVGVGAACSNSETCGVDYRGLHFEDSSNRLFAAHDQGIFRYDVGTSQYVPVEGGLINTQFYGLDVGSGGTIYGGTQDKDAYRKEGDSPWVGIAAGGDVLDVLVDPTNDKHVFFRDNAQTLFYSTNGGSMQNISGFLPFPGFWNHQMVYAPAPAQKTVYAATESKGVYKSINDGQTFPPANVGIENKTIRCLAMQPNSASTLFAGTENEGVYKTTDGGGLWEKLPNFPAAGALVLAVGADGKQVYAGTADGIYHSADGGSSWEPKNNGLAGTKVVSELVIDAKCPCRLLAGLGYYSLEGLYGGGVYETVDGGENWTPLSPEKERSMTVTSIRIDPFDPSRLHIATYGAGIRTLFREVLPCPCL